MAIFPDSHDPSNAVALAILAKAPVAGRAKTRLIPLLGDAGAAALQRWLLQRTVSTALAADVGPVTLWCAGQTDHPDFALCRASGRVALQRQPEGDLGVRMLAAATASASAASVLVIGTDCPAFSPAILREAAAALAQHDAVLIPAEDGGYVLIGMRRPAPEVFAHIEWGSGRVALQTRTRLRRLGWSWTEPATLWDVDRPADYERLVAVFNDIPSAPGR